MTYQHQHSRRSRYARRDHELATRRPQQDAIERPAPQPVPESRKLAAPTESELRAMAGDR